MIGDRVREQAAANKDPLPNLLVNIGGEAAKTNPALAPAFGFLSSMMKDRSAIDESTEFLKIAVGVCPHKATYALNLAHIYELRSHYADAINVRHYYILMLMHIISNQIVFYW